LTMRTTSRAGTTAHLRRSASSAARADYDLAPMRRTSPLLVLSAVLAIAGCGGASSTIKKAVAAAAAAKTAASTPATRTVTVEQTATTPDAGCAAVGVPDAHPERTLSTGEQRRYDQALIERERGVPTQYITGHQEFWGMDLIVTPAVLIPRPETEHVIETVLELVRVGRAPSPAGPWQIVDVGTGSGCIALALAKELPHAEINATEISPAALEIARANVLGYSMGGAIAQELVCRYPERVLSLVLCATLCGGRRAVYARPTVISIMHDLDGLDAAAAARRIWTVTYQPEYLAANIDAVELQMQRELETPTPLHAADLQFQAFVDFDTSEALSSVRSPTLIMTGDSDVLIPPRNSEVLAELMA